MSGDTWLAVTTANASVTGTLLWPEVPVVLFARPFLYVLTAAVLAVALSGCARDAAPAHDAITDDFGDTLIVRTPPRRIVSLNPTTTELLFAIGAGARVVGRTSYDLYPAEVLEVTDLGQGLRPNIEAVLATRPDLVLLYASADNRDAARRLRANGVSTAAYKIDRIADMSRVTMLLGRLTGDTVSARRTVDSVHATLDRVRRETSALRHPTVFWPLWETPLLSVGGTRTATTTQITSQSTLSDFQVGNVLSVAASNSVFAFATQPLNTWLTPQSSVITNDGTETEAIVARISTLTAGANTWTLSAVANGADQARAQWSTTSSSGPWTDISAYATNFTVSASLAASATLTLYLRLQTPTSTTSLSQYSSTLTVTAQ